MTSDLLQLASSAFPSQQNNYMSLAIYTAVVYDYVLVFPKEVEYIWSKPWTRVSTLFILVRYCGLCNLAGEWSHTRACEGTSPQISMINVAWITVGLQTIQGEILNEVELWTYPIFIGAADLVMILRIWAMNNQSRPILYVLLAFYFVEIVSILASSVAYSDPENYRYDTIQLLEYSSCDLQNTSLIWVEVSCILQVTLATVLCMFAVIQLARRSIATYDVTKRWHWQLNQYIELIVKQGILYFFAIFLMNLVSILGFRGKLPDSGWQFTLFYIMKLVPAYTLSPRFIISIREMHAHDVRGRRGGGSDTGFGLSTFSARSSVSLSVVLSAGMQNRVVDNVEGTQGRSLNEGREDIGEVPREAVYAQP